MISEEELKQIKLFQSVDLESIKGLIDACTIRSLEQGEVLITAGQKNRTVYFLLSGRVRIHLDSLDSEPTAILGPGESVAEMSVIDHQPASAFVVRRSRPDSWRWMRRSSGPWSTPPMPPPAIS